MLKGNIRFKIGRKVRGKTSQNNAYMFVEYESDKSMKINPIGSGIRKGAFPYTRVAFKAGTNTFVQIRKSKR